MLQIHLVKSKKVKIQPKSRWNLSLSTGGVSGVRGGGERRGSGTVSEETFLNNSSKVPSPEVSDSKIKKSVKSNADSFGQIPSRSRTHLRLRCLRRLAPGSSSIPQPPQSRMSTFCWTASASTSSPTETKESTPQLRAACDS